MSDNAASFTIKTHSKFWIFFYTTTRNAPEYSFSAKHSTVNQILPSFSHTYLLLPVYITHSFAKGLPAKQQRESRFLGTKTRRRSCGYKRVSRDLLYMCSDVVFTSVHRFLSCLANTLQRKLIIITVRKNTLHSPLLYIYTLS